MQTEAADRRPRPGLRRGATDTLEYLQHAQYYIDRGWWWSRVRGPATTTTGCALRAH
eukprot:COSAG01_NODE_16102_length_1270_cov_1.371477_3_plen_56_part_01